LIRILHIDSKISLSIQIKYWQISQNCG